MSNKYSFCSIFKIYKICRLLHCFKLTCSPTVVRVCWFFVTNCKKMLSVARWLHEIDSLLHVRVARFHDDGGRLMLRIAVLSWRLCQQCLLDVTPRLQGFNEPSAIAETVIEIRSRKMRIVFRVDEVTARSWRGIRLISWNASFGPLEKRQETLKNVASQNTLSYR